MSARSDLRRDASSEFRRDLSVVGEGWLLVVEILRRRGPKLEVDKKRCTNSGSEK